MFGSMVRTRYCLPIYGGLSPSPSQLLTFTGHYVCFWTRCLKMAKLFPTQGRFDNNPSNPLHTLRTAYSVHGTERKTLTASLQTANTSSSLWPPERVGASLKTRKSMLFLTCSLLSLPRRCHGHCHCHYHCHCHGSIQTILSRRCGHLQRLHRIRYNSTSLTKRTCSPSIRSRTRNMRRARE